MYRAILFWAFTLPGLPDVTVRDLVDAARWFSAAISKQLEIVQNTPSPKELAQLSVDYAQAKTHYFRVLTAMVPKLEKIASGKVPMPPEIGNLGKACSGIGEEGEKLADKGTLKCLARFYQHPEVEMAQSEFIRAQKVEEDFHRELMFDHCLCRLLIAAPGGR